MSDTITAAAVPWVVAPEDDGPGALVPVVGGPLVQILEDDGGAGERLLAIWQDTLDSDGTRRGYGTDVREALAMLGGLFGVTDITRLAKWRRTLVDRIDLPEDDPANLAPGTVARKLVALRRYLEFCRDRGKLQIGNDVIARILKSPTAKVIKPYQVMSIDEQERLLAAAGEPRYRALVALLLGAGLRASEVCSLRVRDLIVDMDGDLIVYVHLGKGRKSRAVPLPNWVEVEVYAYLAKRGIEVGAARDAGACLFPGRFDGQPMTTGWLRKLTDKLLADAGIGKAISPHSMRHTYAIGMLKQGASLPGVQKLLGHASLATTQRYLDHLDLDDLKREVKARALEIHSR